MQEGIAIYIVQILTVEGEEKQTNENKLFKYQLHIQNVQHFVKHFIYVINLFCKTAKTNLNLNLEGVHLSDYRCVHRLGTEKSVLKYHSATPTQDLSLYNT